MKAYVYREGGKAWKMENVPNPEPGPDEVLIKVGAAGVCGTDTHYRSGRAAPKSVPLIPGHEIAGTIAELGEGVENAAVGDRVCVHYVVSCARCRHCDEGNDNRCRNRRSIGTHIPGGFAEYVVAPSRNAFKLPDSVSLEVGAIIGCAVSTAYHAVRCGGLAKGDTVVVFGLGGVGMHAVKWAHYFGAGRVIGVDVVESKRRKAGSFGADVVLDPQRDDVARKILELTGGYGADMALECSGHPDSMSSAVKSLHGKSVYESGILVGVAAYMDEIAIDRPWLFREGAFIRSGDHTRKDLREVIQLAGSGRINLEPSITHRFGFEKLETVLECLEERRDDIIRAVLVLA